MLLPAKAGKQPTATASHEGSAKRTEMTCGLRWILSKCKIHETLLLTFCYVTVFIEKSSSRNQPRSVFFRTSNSSSVITFSFSKLLNRSR
jgi:hypothetical protein